MDCSPPANFDLSCVGQVGVVLIWQECVYVCMLSFGQLFWGEREGGGGNSFFSIEAIPLFG